MSIGYRYLQRINDGRKVWLGQQCVNHVAGHPSLAPTARRIASLLDKQEAPETTDLLTYPLKEKPHRANLAFLIPESQHDLQRRHQAFRFDPEFTFGMADGPSQHIRSVLGGHYAFRHYSGLGAEYADKLQAYYEYVRDRDLICAAASFDPQSRSSAGDEAGSGLQIVRETKEGIIVKGARMASANAPFADEILVSFHDPGPGVSGKDGPMFAVKAGTPGLHIVCRESLLSADRDDAPISGQFAEMDAVLVFDEVFVPWERVFIKDDPEALHRIQRNPAAVTLGRHQAVVRLLGHLEFLAAVGHALVSASESKTLLHVQEQMGELIIQLETLRGLLLSAEHPAGPSFDGVWLPDEQPLRAACNLGARFYPRAIEIVRQLGAGALLQRPAGLADFHGAIGHFLREYDGGADRDAFSRTRLVKLAWDLIGSPLAARRTLYEQFLWGDPVLAYAEHYEIYPKETLTEPVWRLVHAPSQDSKE